MLLTFGYHYLKISITGLCAGLAAGGQRQHISFESLLCLSPVNEGSVYRNDFEEPEPNCSALVLGANSENCLLPIPTPAPSTFPQGQVFEAHQNCVCIGCHQSCHHCMKQIQNTCKVAGLTRCLSINRPRIHHNFTMGTRLMPASDFLSWNSIGGRAHIMGVYAKNKGLVC